MINTTFFSHLMVFSTLFLLCSFTSMAQWGVSYHQSDISFVAVNYEINERFVPEFRLGTNVYFDNGFSPELVFSYKPIIKDDFHFYAGGGVIINDSFGGIHTPFGLQVYPFEEKNFGFLMELSPFVINFNNGSEWIRGSLGIRYRFLNN